MYKYFQLYPLLFNLVFSIGMIGLIISCLIDSTLLPAEVVSKHRRNRLASISGAPKWLNTTRNSMYPYALILCPVIPIVKHEIFLADIDLIRTIFLNIASVQIVYVHITNLGFILACRKQLI
jgi:hypothetical protein